MRNAIASSHRFLTEPPRAAHQAGRLDLKRLNDVTLLQIRQVASGLLRWLRQQCPRSAIQESLPLL